MKKISVTGVLIVIFAIFIFTFILGKSNAMKEDDKEKTSDIETQTENDTEEMISPASTSSENIEKTKTDSLEESDLETEKEPPDRMYFPCGETVLKEYSQQAIYSKTMDDWRAHTGIDYKADIGSDVISIWDGAVKNIYKDSLWGYVIEIKHDGEITSVYKNLDENVYVKIGESVKKGQVIGKVGDSASIERKEEPHLHFELWTSDMAINPNSYIY